MVKILELFSGYGTASFALKRLGIPYELVGYSDIDKYANQCFQQNHVGKELGDCTKINPNDLEDFDLLTGGFPCQAFSVAGKGLGELDTRGTLFNEIIRIAEIKKPRYMLLENVKGLLSKKHKPTFEKIISELYRIGYFVKWEVLNTKEYGIPQNRERVFICCFKYWNDFCNFSFPEKEELNIFIKDILEGRVDDKYYLSKKAKERLIKRNNLCKKDGTIGCITSTIYKVNWNTPLVKDRNSYIQCDFGNHSQQDRIYNTETILPTIVSNVPKIIDNYNNKIKTDEIIGTLGSNCGCSTATGSFSIFEEGDIRRLTPKECFRAQGFLNDEVNLDGLSDTQRYKLAGNGQSVNVVTKIFERMFVLE